MLLKTRAEYPDNPNVARAPFRPNKVWRLAFAPMSVP